MALLTPVDPDWRPPFCACNERNSYHPLGHATLCSRWRLRVAAGHASHRMWKRVMAAYWRRLYRRRSRGGGFTRIPKVPR